MNTTLIDVSNMSGTDTLFLYFMFYRTDTYYDDRMYIGLHDKNDNLVAGPVVAYRHKYKPPYTSTDGWKSLYWTISGDNFSSLQTKKVYFRFMAVSDNGYNLYMDDIEVKRTQSNTDYIRVIQPNGGEKKAVGKKDTIIWNSSPDIQNVDVDYSANGGSAWKSLRKNVSTNQYSSIIWTIPDNPSEKCLVRVSSTSNPNTKDQSDIFFTIYEPPPQITILQPNSWNEVLETATTYKIKWSAYKTNKVKIDYSTNNKRNWAPVASDVNAGTGSFSWVVPNTPSTDCYIRIISMDDNTVGDTNRYAFEIRESKYPDITLTAPEKGKEYKSTEDLLIKWISTKVDKVKIETTLDGSNWEELVTNYDASGGEYKWDVPHVSTSKAKVRITSMSNTSIRSESDEFTIMDASSTEDQQFSKWRVYPNPVKQKANISLNGIVLDRLEVKDMTGKTVKSVNLSEPFYGNNLILDVSDLENGVYILESTNSRGDVLKKRLLITRNEF